MVANISHSNDLYTTLTYNQNKVDAGEAHVLGVNEMWVSFTGTYHINDFVRAFKTRLDVNDRTKKPIVHISLNPHPQDVLSDEQLLNIGNEYMQKMGFANQPYVIFKHEDIARHHIHIVTTNVDENGQKINDSFERRRSKEITRSIEKEYQLHPADIRQDNRVWIPDKVTLEKGRVKYQIKNVVAHLLDNYRIGSFNEYKAALSLYNIEAQQVKGELSNGQTYSGLIYVPTDDSGKRIATPIKSSAMGVKYGLAEIERQFPSGEDELKKLNKESTKKILRTCISAASSREDLMQRLHASGIDIAFRTNEAGRIYGATIIDNKAKIILNGSKLGKEFSANVFHSMFEKWQLHPSENPINTPDTTADISQQQAVQKEKNRADFSLENSLVSDFSSGSSEQNFVPDIGYAELGSDFGAVWEHVQESNGDNFGSLLDMLFTPVAGRSSHTSDAEDPEEKKKKRKKKNARRRI